MPDTRDIGQISVIGAGTMGVGIALVAARHGHAVHLADTSPPALMRAQTALDRNLTRFVEKGTLTQEEAHALKHRIVLSESQAAAGESALVIEAIIEDAAIKKEEFSRIENIVAPDCIIATNTSSLGITALASGLQRPERFIGIHFFNPAPIMPLVEIVPGLRTGESTIRRSRDLIVSWGKTTVLAKDLPGFIVNRIARPFYSEALLILEEGLADAAGIDAAMRDGGFRMGPFELMDLIGNDVNAAVTGIVWRQLHYSPVFRPSILQQRLVEAGFFGRKSGRGFYDYAEGATKATVGQNQELATAIFNRILVMMINGAAEALRLGVAGRDDIDLAMTTGVNYPRGLLQWADEIGIGAVVDRLAGLYEEYTDPRYAPSPLLKRMAREGRTFY